MNLRLQRDGSMTFSHMFFLMNLFSTQCYPHIRASELDEAFKFRYNPVALKRHILYLFTNMHGETHVHRWITKLLRPLECSAGNEFAVWLRNFKEINRM